MAIQTGTATEVAATDNEAVISLEKVDETRQAYDLQSAKEKYELEIRQSGKIDALTSTIDISNTNTIIEFGKEPAEKMATLADQVLAKYNGNMVDDTSKMVDSLLSVMKKIDIKEIKSLQEITEERNKKGLFAKFKESASDKLNRLVNKYKTIGGEMENICRQLSVYEQQIKDSNVDIARMYEEAKTEYKEFVAIIMAAEQACTEIEEYRDQKQKEFEQTGNNDIQFELQNINQALTLMQQRTADLKGSESVALMSIPTFKVQEYTNANLARKVNSAFIVTVPAFKTALVNSVIAKQQSIQAQGLSMLDDASSQLIRQNAENSVAQLKMSQQLANTSAIKADDIEYAWNTIMTGISEYKEMEKQYSQVREDEKKRIDAANNRYLASLANGEAI